MFTKLHDRRIRVGVGVGVGPMEFKLYCMQRAATIAHETTSLAFVVRLNAVVQSRRDDRASGDVRRRSGRHAVGRSPSKKVRRRLAGVTPSGNRHAASPIPIYHVQRLNDGGARLVVRWWRSCLFTGVERSSRRTRAVRRFRRLSRFALNFLPSLREVYSNVRRSSIDKHAVRIGGGLSAVEQYTGSSFPPIFVVGLVAAAVLGGRMAVNSPERDARQFYRVRGYAVRNAAWICRQSK